MIWHRRFFICYIQHMLTIDVINCVGLLTSLNGFEFGLLMAMHGNRENK